MIGHRHQAAALSGLLLLTSCSGSPSDGSTAKGSGSTSAETATPARYRSDAGVVFRVPGDWSVHPAGRNAAIVPPGVSFDPKRSDNTGVYVIIGAEDDTDLDAPDLVTTLEALLAADNLAPRGPAQKDTIDAGGRPARRFSWRGPTVAVGTLALHAYLVRDDRAIVMVVAAAETEAMSRRDAALRDVAASLAWDPAGTRFADARPASAGTVAPPAPPTGGGMPGTAITGTWTGKLSGQPDTIDDARFRFSAAGNLLYEYGIRGGEVRSVEWTAVGQKVQYIPPNGGVQTITIQALERGPGRLSIAQRWVFERSGSFLEQTFLTSRGEFTLTPAGLTVTLSNTTERYMNGNPVGTEQETYTGVLKPGR